MLCPVTSCGPWHAAHPAVLVTVALAPDGSLRDSIPGLQHCSVGFSTLLGICGAQPLPQGGGIQQDLWPLYRRVEAVCRGLARVLPKQCLKLWAPQVGRVGELSRVNTCRAVSGCGGIPPSAKAGGVKRSQRMIRSQIPFKRLGQTVHSDPDVIKKHIIIHKCTNTDILD